MTTSKRILRIIVAVVVCNAIGVAGALTTSPNSEWFMHLEKPSFQPPGWLFGPVWTLLYTMMGLAAARVYERRTEAAAKTALTLFVLQLVLNGLWSPVFFAWHQVGAALVIIVVLTGLVVWTTKLFFGIDRVAGALLVPYVGWLSFATVLNATIFRLN